MGVWLRTAMRVLVLWTGMGVGWWIGMGVVGWSTCIW